MSMTGLRRLWQEVTRVRKLPCYHVLSGLLYVVVLSANTTGFKRILWSFAITTHSHAWWILKVACFSQSQYVRVGGWVVQSIQWGQSQWNRLWLSLERLGAPSRQHQRLDPTEKWVLWGASPQSNRPCRPGKKIKSLSRLFWYPTPMVLFLASKLTWFPHLDKNDYKGLMIQKPPYLLPSKDWCNDAIAGAQTWSVWLSRSRWTSPQKYTNSVRKGWKGNTRMWCWRGEDKSRVWLYMT